MNSFQSFPTWHIIPPSTHPLIQWVTKTELSFLFNTSCLWLLPPLLPGLIQRIQDTTLPRVTLSDLSFWHIFLWIKIWTGSPPTMNKVPIAAKQEDSLTCCPNLPFRTCCLTRNLARSRWIYSLLCTWPPSFYCEVLSCQRACHPILPSIFYSSFMSYI